MNDNQHLPYSTDALILGTLAIAAGWLFKLGNRLRATT